VSEDAPNDISPDRELDAAIRDHVQRLVNAEVVVQALQERGLDPEVRRALIDQLNAWIRLAEFAKWLSVGLAIGAGIISAFLIYAMTWQDLFTGSSLWEFGLILFALAVFVASPLAIFVLGRPLKGVDEWAPTLSTPGQSGSSDKANTSTSSSAQSA
jgi:hypothetical protein